MANHGCINGMLQGTDKYSAPVPVIGLYIAAASALCAILMLNDILHGFVKMQRWLPCKWFKLNSVTLSLIGVVVKLTVDLTTSMPSALDQLSKLAGTVSLCIYMCYIYPSISDMKDSTNMFALSILVVTVIVNICIQLSTGVIALFFTEHIVVMCIMLTLLGTLWLFVFVAKNEKRNSVATGKSEFMTGKFDAIAPGGVKPESFLQRLKVCYLDNYKINPQFRTWRRMDCGVVGDLSLISSAILIQAAIRAFVLKKENLCTGTSSDYRWSMGMIMVTQFVFIMVGSFSSYFRLCTMLLHADMRADPKLIEEPHCSNPILKEYSNEGWLKLKSASNMEKLIEGSERKLKDLCNLLSSIIPVHSVIGSFDAAVDSPRYQEPTKEIQLPPARLHPLVVLVRLVEVAIPESPSQGKIVKTFGEAFETLHFIEKNMHNTTLRDIKETEIAKAVWAAGDFSSLLPVNLRSSNQFPPVDHAFRLMKCIYEKMNEKGYSTDNVGNQVYVIRDFLNQWSYSSPEDLGNYMQDLFVYMLNVILAQLPNAIFKAVSQSPDDEFEERVRQSLKHLSMLQSWDGIHKWEPPQGCKNCTDLLDPGKPAAQSVVIQNPAPVTRNDDVPSNPPVQGEGEGWGDTGNDILRSAEHRVTITDEDGIVEIQSI